MIKLALNMHKYNNYAFFCPVSRLHVTVANPVGYVNEVSPAILKALKSKTLLDIDGVIDIETGGMKVAADETSPKEEDNNGSDSKQEETASTDTVNDTATEETSEPVPEKPKRTRKKANAE